MEKVSELIVSKLLKNKIIISDKQEIYKTGIMLILADIINFFLVLMIGIITKSFLCSIIYLIVFSQVRKFSGGFHAKTFWLCRIVTVGTYVLIVLTSGLISRNYILITLCCDIFTLITMIVFAPVHHPNKDLTQKEEKANKLFAVLTTSIFTAVSITLVIFSRKEGMVISLILLAISILMYAGMLTNGKEEK